MATAYSAVAAAVAAGNTVDISLKTGTNDVSGASGCTGITNDQILSNIRKAWTNYQAAGARYLFLWNVDPRGSGNASQINSLNRLFEDFAGQVPNVFYMDATAWLLDPTTNVDLLGYPTGATAAFSTSTDDLHITAYGYFREASAWDPAILSRLYPARKIQTLRPETYSSIATRANLIGSVGRFTALGGTDSTTKSGTGTVTGTPPNGWTLSGTLDGSLSVAFSTVTCSALDSYQLGSGSQCVRMVFSGTPATAQNLKLLHTSTSIAFTGGATAAQEFLVNFNALVGLCYIYPAPNVVSGSFINSLWGACTSPSSQIGTLNGLHYFANSSTSVTFGSTGTSMNAQINIEFMPSVAASGSIDLISVALRRKDAVPPSS